jgi:type II secretory pathway pseudopilin PulG
MLHIKNPRLSAFLARRRAKGVTLLELAMYLGIAGIIAGGALASFSSSSNAQKVTDTLNMIGQVQQTARSVTQGSSDYDGLTTQIVAQSNQLPRKFVRSGGTTLTNPFNGTTDIALNASNARFAIVMTGIPRDACTKLAPADMGPGVASVTVSGTGTAAPPSNLPSNPTISPSDANSQCSGTANSIAWEFF